MKKRTRFKSKGKALARDFLVAFSCLSVFFVSLWLLWNDLNASSTRSDKDAIATISFKYKVAQRKFTDRVVWERLQQNSPLYDEDTIRTADFATATITFKTGEVLAVRENTMVQIFKSSDGGVRLSVEDGGIDVDTSDSKTSSAVSIEMKDGSQISLEAGSRLSATSKADGNSNLQLQSGSGTVSGDVQLAAGETVMVEKGQVQKVPVSVTSISNDLWILNDEKTPSPVHLEWVTSSASDDGSPKNYVVQTSRTKDFSQIDASYEVQDTNYVELTVSEGNVYWRVFEDESPENAVSGKIRLNNLVSPRLLSPLENSVYKYRKNSPQIPFNWEETDLAQYYRLEISTSPDFQTVSLSKDVQASSYTVSDLPEGSYFWRVTPYYNIQNTGFKGSSKVASFTLQRAEAVSTPVSISPSDGASLFYTGESLSTTFRWKKEDLNAEYEVQVSDSGDFSSIVYSDTTNQNRIQKEFTPQTLPVGTYYWRLCRYALPEEQLEQEWSDIKSFTVALYSPKKSRLVYPPDNFYTDSQNLLLTVFSWKVGDEFGINKADENDIESIIQFSKSQDFSSIVQEKQTLQNQAERILLDGGKYYWRVALRQNDSSKFYYTQTQSLTVLKELEAVSFSSPQPSQTVLVSEVRPLRVSWKPCDEADYYDVKLLNKADGSVLKQTQAKDLFTLFNVQDLFDSKSLDVECTIQPVARATEYADERLGSKSFVNFTLRKPDFVTLVSPAREAKILGLDALRTPVKLSWHEGIDIPQKSQLTVQKLSSGGRFINYEVIENPQKEVSLENLSEGSYRWIVRASLSDGTLLNAPDYSYFSVSPIPELEKPVLQEPANGFIINAGFLRKNRSLKFKWREVPDATDYTFTLYKKTGGRLLHVATVKNGKSTSLSFKELKLLDVGEFEWQVTAYSINKKGFEEQHSKASAGSFRIDIQLPKNVNVKNPGEFFIE